MIEGSDGARFQFEAPQPLGVRPHFGRQDLDCDLAPETRVPRPVHLAHPPDPKKVEDLVRPEPRADGKGHPEAPWNPLE